MPVKYNGGLVPPLPLTHLLLRNRQPLNSAEYPTKL
jgi:hypothetical protein